MPLVLLALPFLICMGLTVFLVDDPILRSWILGACVIPLVLIFFFRQQIFRWYYKKYPPKLDEPMRKVLETSFPYYANLSAENKQKFDVRLSLYLIEKDYEKMKLETISEEIKGLLGANAIRMTFGLENFTFSPFDLIVLYPQMFPTPILPKFHASEVHEEGEQSCMIFSSEHLLHTFLKPKEGYNIAAHEFANVYRLKNDVSDVLKFDKPEIYPTLQKIRGASLENIKMYMGKPTVNFFALCVEHFFYNPAVFQKELPELYSLISKKLNQDPTNAENPVINYVLT